MSIAAIKAGKAFYEIFAEDKTQAGLSSAEQGLQRFGARIGMIGASLAAVAAAGLTSLSAMAATFATFGDEIGDAMAKTGVSAEWLQVFDIAADKADVSFSQIVASIGKMQRGINDGKIQKGLNLIGMSVGQLQGMKPEEQFLAIGDAIGKIQDPAQRSAAALAIFGKSGVGLLPLLEGGSQGLIDTFNRINSEGAFLDAADIKTAGELDDALVMLRANISQLVNIIGAAVAPAMKVVVDGLGSAARMAAKFVDNSRFLVTTLGGSLVVIGAVGVALMGLGAAAIFASLATTGLGMLMTALGAVAAFLISPFFVIAAAITACAVAAGVAVYQLDQVHNSGKGLKTLQEDANAAAQAIGLIGKALIAGEWTLAIDYIGTSLEAAFDGAILSIKQKWSDLITFIATSNPFASADEIAAIKQDANEKLSAERQAVLDSTSRQLALAARIAGLNKTSGPLTGASNRIALESASGAIRDLQTGGVLSAAAAERINQNAPGNQWQDKLVSETEKQTGILEDIRDGFDGLEGLTVE